MRAISKSFCAPLSHSPHEFRRSPPSAGLPACTVVCDRHCYSGASAAPAPAVLDCSASDLARPIRCLRMSSSGERDHAHITGASIDYFDISRADKVAEHSSDGGNIDQFSEMKQRFLYFKARNYVGNPENYKNLAERQEPKFLVIACSDSRVCPSDVLGFQPGEAFTVRNIANLVPSYEHGPSETKAALEFAVTILEVENVLVVGHSRCGGIQALMSMKDETDPGTPSFIRDWVATAKNAKLSAEAAAGNLSFDLQCRHCEKESINGSLLNLLTYPWIKQRVNEGKLSLHGGYYNFVDCNFEKWTLVYKEDLKGGSKYSVENRSLWS